MGHPLEIQHQQLNQSMRIHSDVGQVPTPFGRRAADYGYKAEAVNDDAVLCG